VLRQQEEKILSDLLKKMVFLSGPRQAGKTWLSREIANKFPSSLYLNWDNPQDREVILDQAWSTNLELLVLDEVHKMEGWKNFLKGIWDTRPRSMKILVTGSARLETFRQSGDSLAGRYYHHRLLPFTPEEVSWAGEHRGLDDFLTRGGFPEPFLSLDPNDARRWQKQYLDGLVREDILNYENIGHLKAMNLLVELLRSRVASPLSYQSLAEDLSIAPNTVKKYIAILEALYLVFLVYPFSRSISRSLLQQPKLYFFDTALVKDIGARLENLVGVSLLRNMYFREDIDGIPRGLHYLRTKEGKEVDFLLTQEEKPLKMIEVKSTDFQLSKNLEYFHRTYGFSGTQLVADLRLERFGALEVRHLYPWLEAPELWD